MSNRTLENPDVITATLYLPDQSIRQIPYEPTPEDYTNMDLALDEARVALSEGNVAVGAVFAAVLGKETMIFSGHSTEIQDDDLDKHAEFNTYRKCQPTVGRDLSMITAYVTSEPCDSCAHRFVQGHVGKLVYGASYNDAPEYFRVREYGLSHKLRYSGRTILVVSGLRKVEALELLTAENKVH